TKNASAPQSYSTPTGKRKLRTWTTVRSPSFRFEWDRLARQFAQGIHRGALLGVLLVTTPGRCKALPPDLRGDLEALRMVRALLVEQQVGRGLTELSLGHLLQVALVVDAPVAADRQVDLGLDVLDDEPLR